jgi:hypothetical protein
MHWHHDDGPMMAAGMGRWRSRVLAAALLACLVLVQAACTNGSNTINVGSCDAQGGGNGAACGQASKAGDPGAGARPGSMVEPRQSSPASSLGPQSLVTVQMAGSSTFLDDINVRNKLTQNHVTLQDASLGSRQVCKIPGLIAKFDVSDSGSDDAATCVGQLVIKAGLVPHKVSPYSSPMVIMTHAPIVHLLQQIPGLVTPVNGLKIFNVAKYLSVFASGEEWVNIPGNTTYPSLNRILLWTTDPRNSNSGGMLAALAYAAQNANDDPVTTLLPGDTKVPVIKSLFTELGSLPTHTPDLLRQFLTLGMDGRPMALVYESDYLGAVLTHEIPAASDITVMYPNPDVTAEETFVSWTQKGNKLTSLLTSSPMQDVEEAHGYRTSQDAYGFAGYMAARNIAVPSVNTLLASLQFARLPSESSLLALINAVTAG